LEEAVMTSRIKNLRAARSDGSPQRQGLMAAIIAVGLTPAVIWTGI
jgi:hypothetical protein